MDYQTYFAQKVKKAIKNSGIQSDILTRVEENHIAFVFFLRGFGGF